MSASRDLRGRQYAVVGGGMSGLAAAWYLQGHGAQTHIFERAGELGGRACSGELAGRAVMLGGASIGRGFARFRAFASSNGDHRYEPVAGGGSHAATAGGAGRSRQAGVAGSLPGASPRDRVRLAQLAHMRRSQHEARLLCEESCRALRERYGEASMHDAFSERLRAVTLRSLTLELSGAEPDEVPMGNALPYLQTHADTRERLCGGMRRLIGAAARRSRISVGTAVRSLTLEGDRVCGVQLRTPDGQVASERFDGVVLATDAHAAASLLEETAPATASLLRGVRYFPIVVLLVEYERAVFERPAMLNFGAERALSGAVAQESSELNLVRYTFSGRRARLLSSQEPDPEALARIAETAVQPYGCLAGNGRRAMTARLFSPGLCAYRRDQDEFLASLRSAEALPAGLHLTGDYLRGCSFEACFAAAEQAVGEA